MAGINPHINLENPEILRSWLEMALMRTDSELWVYTPSDKHLDVYGFNEQGESIHSVFEDAPASCIDGGHVHPDSIEDLNSLFRAIDQGREREIVSVRLKQPSTGDFAWCSLSYQLHVSEDGTVDYAVGMRSAPRSAFEDRFPVKGTFPEALYPYLMRFGQANVSRGRMRLLLRRDERRVHLLREIPYANAIEMGAATLFSSNDQTSYRELLDPCRLVERYQAGRRWSVARYRMVGAGSTIMNARIAICVSMPEQGDDLIASIYVNACDSRSNWEAKSEISAVRDRETQLYSQGYAKLLINSLMGDESQNDVCAICAIVLDGASGISENLRADLITAIGVFMNTDCIAYLYNETTIGIFFPKIPSSSAVKRRLTGVFKAVRDSFRDADATSSEALASVRLIASTVFGFLRTFDFNVATLNAYEMALKHTAESASEDGDVVDDPLALRDLTMVQQTVRADMSDIPDIDSLSREELVAYAETLRAMQDAEAPSQAVYVALRAAGLYYRARRAYVLMMPKDDETMTVLYEWTAPSIMSIQSLFSKTPASRFPFILANVGSDRPVFVSHRHSASHPDGSENQDPWRFSIIPISHAAACAMALCIDGPSDHLNSWSLASCLGGRILHEWIRLTRASRSKDPMVLASDFSLHDDRDLEMMLARSNRNPWGSAGMLVVTLADLQDVSNEIGFKGVFDLYIKVRMLLTSLFGEELVFHTSDIEFVALSPNQPYNSFIQRCGQARLALHSLHPDWFSLGSSWSDNSRDVYGILSEARAVAKRDNSHKVRIGHRNDHGANDTEQTSFPLPFTSPRPLQGGYTIYLQPKIDMRTGALVGAEALARSIGSDGVVNAPASDIRRLEEDGTISELDYFVFDAMLATMNSWKSRGITIVPISSNFSRNTLLGSTALASVLAILSRYPEIPVDKVEMEITEAAIDLGNHTLSEVVERYRSLGLRVALDDFGSHYSNASVLANVHFDTIKLDRSLIGDLPGNEVSRLLVRNIADICKSQNMCCIAEGIESIDQARALVEEGCNICQGFYYDLPMPVELFERKYFEG
ncbi:EAL domain-containing protein [Collinsella ihumii]|uniref:EAL domain-containing protein n=1 Tax=Collinsella ihumii TaxID=1720204 RepID=A0AAW7JMN6_9ACTN|nr:EAL domain-containing protein [Collinsella ihumii]MDN0068215.1 EAL domain-containing protein [Collinsella ihumii]